MQNCVLRMLAFRQISYRKKKTKKKKKRGAGGGGFCEWGLNSYNNVNNFLSEKGGI